MRIATIYISKMRFGAPGYYEYTLIFYVDKRERMIVFIVELEPVMSPPQGRQRPFSVRGFLNTLRESTNMQSTQIAVSVGPETRAPQISAP